MNKKALAEYALFARKELENQIKLSLNRLGIFPDCIKTANIVGDFTVVEGTQEAFPKRVFSLRNSIIEGHLKEKGFNGVVEEFAYTWFNRIIAIRFLEVHDYFPHGFRVLTSRDGSFEPEILKNLPYVKDELKLDMSVVESLKNQNKIEELYRYVLFKQCNSLSPMLPMLFDEQDSYLELLLPANLLSEGSVVRRIENIPEEDFKNDVEVIGWLYQYYVESNREQYRTLPSFGKAEIPTLTQIFTPDWIVRYMVQNSLGRFWVEQNPDSQLKDQMTFYCRDNTNGFSDSANSKCNFSDVEQLTFIEPCCGSGHILLYAFDLFFQIYLEKGYSQKDIPALILSKNLFGLDIDKRSAQLSQFALMMKARSIDSHFFSKDRIVFPKVFEIGDSADLVRQNYQAKIASFGYTKKAQDIIKYLIETFTFGKTIGSLLNVTKMDYQCVIDETTKIQDSFIPDLLESSFFEVGLSEIKLLAEDGKILSSQFDVMVTNPPYLSVSKLEEPSKGYISRYYPLSKDDFFASFMMTNLVKAGGYTSLVNPDSWMFLNSFEKMRSFLLSRETLIALAHIGMGAFDATVQTAASVWEKMVPHEGEGEYVDLRDVACDDKPNAFQSLLKDQNEKKYLCEQRLFLSIPGETIAYWANSNLLEAFSKGISVSSISDFTGSQNKTADNDRFMRFCWELPKNEIDDKEWVFYAKGGDFRKWFGNNQRVVDWRPAARQFYSENKTSNLLKEKYWFKEGITYTSFSSFANGFRYLPPIGVFDIKGPSLISVEHLEYCLAFFNSKVASAYFDLLNPTVTLQVKDVKNVPIILDENVEKTIIPLVKENIAAAEKDWNSVETSWWFSRDPLIGEGSLKDITLKFEEGLLSSFRRMKGNEETINTLFNKLYKVDDYLSSKEEDKEVTLRLPNRRFEITALLSYCVGLIMGRFSLERPGLVFAGGVSVKKSLPSFVSEDGIIPLYQFANIEDGLGARVCDLISSIYGQDHYQENLQFIAASLGGQTDESSEETINRYFLDSFYADHVKMYQKRPIYWMFSSGKHNAFRCILYLHKYSKDTLARINSKYFLNCMNLYKTERSRLEAKLTAKDLELKDRKELDSELSEVVACEEELVEYGQILDHLANQYIDLNLDDGVKNNYVKFQHQSLISDGASITKDLLFPIKGFEGEES